TDAFDVLLAVEKLEPPKREGINVKAGTGDYKTTWSASDIKPEIGNVTLTKKGAGTAWGSLYWHYTEDLEKTTPAETALKLITKRQTDGICPHERYARRWVRTCKRYFTIQMARRLRLL